MINSWFIIANPTSGGGKLAEKWKGIEQLLIQKSITFSHVFTEYKQHEVELVQQAIKEGFKNIVSIGGDGTLHNVVNGIMTQSYVEPSDINVGIIPLGTGNDWIRNYNIPNNIEKAIKILLDKKTILQDIGFLELATTSRYFNNVAGLGFDGYVTKKITNYKLLGSFNYLLGALKGLIKYRPIEFTVKTDTETVKTKSLMTLFGICEYCSGGMKLINYKNSDDGLFAITIVKNFTFSNILLNVVKLFNGKIINHKKVTLLSSSSVSVVPDKTKTAYIQADGELIGTGEVKASIIKKALNFIIA